MGTINYKSGDIITLGLNTDFEVDEDVINELMKLNDFTREDAEQYERDMYQSDAQDISQAIIDDIVDEIDRLGYFETWVSIKIEYGYYDGFSVVVNKNYTLDKNMLWHVEEEDKNEIIKVLEIVRTGLKRLTDNYLDVCYPWWSTRFEEGREANYKAIDDAINGAIEEIEEAI